MQWNRKELKTAAKRNVRANYWPCVFVAFLLALIMAFSAGSTGGQAKGAVDNQKARQSDASFNNVDTREGDLDSEVFSDPDASVSELIDAMGITPSGGPDFSRENITAVGVSVGGIGLLVFLLNLFVFGPLKLGCYGFFATNTNPPAMVGELGKAFRQDYWGNVLTMFLKRLFQMLWSLLFIIPGIVKSYSYRMTPYIRMQHPEISATECITLSRKMMNGHKWRAFVLDLSFLGWFLLDACTLGILGLFWVQPYYQQTDAQLYLALSAQGLDASV